MTLLKTLLGSVAIAATSTAAFADASIVDRVSIGDANYEVQLAEQGVILGAALYGQNDADADAYFLKENFFGTAALGQHDAGYEAALQFRGNAVGTAVYGAYDADYDAFFTADDFFATAALGEYDADYEPVLASREPLGASHFWVSYDTAGLQ